MADDDQDELFRKSPFELARERLKKPVRWAKRAAFASAILYIAAVGSAGVGHGDYTLLYVFMLFAVGFCGVAFVVLVLGLQMFVEHRKFPLEATLCLLGVALLVALAWQP